MFYINQNATKEVIVTLEELSTNHVNPFYTWVITPADSEFSYTFSAIDHSTSPWYYNAFTLSVVPGATYGLTAGVIPVIETGQFKYVVYQMNTNGDLNINNCVKIVEKGLFYINGTYSTSQTYTGGKGDTPVYNG